MSATVPLGAAVIVSLAGCTLSLPPGTRACVGFPAEVCAREVAALEQEGAAHGGVSAYRLACTGSCTVDHGEGTLRVIFRDGSGRDGSFGYAVPVNTPPNSTDAPLVVEPTCIGVPLPRCTELAREIDPNLERTTVVSIAVRCTRTCTEDHGDGETRVTLTDGKVATSGWSYSTGE